MARVKEEEPRVPAVNDLESQAKQYIFFKKQIEYFESEIKSLREKSIKSLYADLQIEKENLSKTRIKLGQEKKIYPHKVQALRKKIARINTIIYQKLAEELNEKSK